MPLPWSVKVCKTKCNCSVSSRMVAPATRSSGSGSGMRCFCRLLSFLWRHNMQSFLQSLTPKRNSACAAASAAFAASLARLSTEGLAVHTQGAKKAGNRYSVNIRTTLRRDHQKRNFKVIQSSLEGEDFCLTATIIASGSITEAAWLAILAA